MQQAIRFAVDTYPCLIRLASAAFQTIRRSKRVWVRHRGVYIAQEWPDRQDA